MHALCRIFFYKPFQYVSYHLFIFNGLTYSLIPLPSTCNSYTSIGMLQNTVIVKNNATIKAIRDRFPLYEIPTIR